MKTLILQRLFIVLFLVTFCSHAQLSGGGEANPDLKTHPEALKRFTDNRFGMFVHWGPVTLRGQELSWSRGNQIPKAEYDMLYREFNPVLFNAKDWVTAAKQAGMKYMVLTTRHHDGFSLWDSKYSDYDMGSTPYGKGVVKALAEECKKQGIDFGMYYSISDWWHEDYPVTYPDPDYKYHVEEKIKDPEVQAKMDRYIKYIKNQLAELIEFTDPSLIWFDGEWEWAWTHEMGMDLYAYLRGLKNDLLINNRVDKGRDGMKGKNLSNIYAGDYETPEQNIGKFDNKNTWETCMTIGTQWSWKANDKLKSTRECIHTLLNTVGRDGNLLFNVAPMFDGRMEERQVARIKEIGDWLSINGEAVYGTRGGPYLPTENMVATRKGKKIYLHLLDQKSTRLELPLPAKTKLKKAYFLANGTSVDFEQHKSGITVDLPEILPDTVATVLVLELNKPTTEEVIEL